MTTNKLRAAIETGLDEGASQDVDEDLGCFERMAFSQTPPAGDGDARGGGEPPPTQAEEASRQSRSPRLPTTTP